MFNLKLQGEVTVTGDEFECRFCNNDAEIVHVHDFVGDLIWEGCANCLIDSLKRQDTERQALKKKLEELQNKKDVDCICDLVTLGCKCGSAAREKYLKKINSLA